MANIYTKINELEAALVRTILNAIRDEKMGEEDMRASANFILDHVEPGFKDEAEVMNFLQELRQKWPVFSPVLQVEKTRVDEIENKEKKISAIKTQLLKFV